MNKPVGARERQNMEAILRNSGAATANWMQRKHVRWAAAFGAVVLVLLATRSFIGSTSSVRYVTEPVTLGNLTVIVTATGSVQPTNKVDVSSELSGTVRKVLVDYNSAVTAGQTLAMLDTDKLVATADSSRAKLAAAKAQVVDAEAALLEKEKILARKRPLAGKQIVSANDLDVAQAAYDRAAATLLSAKADVVVAEADLRLNEINLTKANIVSPISGVVLKRNVDPGQTVASSLQAPVLFSIAEDLRQMELQVDVDEADVGKVRIGQNASFSVDAFPDRKFPATIRDVRFASETIQGVVTYKGVLTIDNSELLLRPGMTATSEIRVTEVQDVVLLPNAGLRYAPPEAPPSQSILRRLLPGPPQFRAPSTHGDAGPNRTVWVLREGKPVLVKIVIGPSDGKRTAVQSGELHSGDALIVDQTTAKQ
ncbi:MAG: efflux RND transporter periplasmic adaptor subunit [Hyphomicrobiaceae bacterium]